MSTIHLHNDIFEKKSLSMQWRIQDFQCGKRRGEGGTLTPYFANYSGKLNEIGIKFVPSRGGWHSKCHSHPFPPAVTPMTWQLNILVLSELVLRPESDDDSLARMQRDLIQRHRKLGFQSSGSHVTCGVHHIATTRHEVAGRGHL